MKSWGKWLLLSALTILFLTGCSGQNGQDMPDASSGSQQAGAEKPAADPGQPAAETGKKTVYPLTVKDATGKTLTIEKAPERIVSTSPAETEILFALGLAEKIVGVSDYDDYPAEALTKPKVGGVVSPNEEAILAQNPDLVIGGISLDHHVAEKFTSLGLPVYIPHPNSLDEIMQNILTMGAITDRQKQAEEIVAKMKSDIERVSEALKEVPAEEQKKVYIEFSPGWTVGRGEFMHELITLAKGVNIAADTEGWNQISEEKVLQADPDVILYAHGVIDDVTGNSLEQIIRSRSGWEKIRAIREQRVIGLEEDLLARPGPRLTQGLIEVAKAIYPDLVK